METTEAVVIEAEEDPKQVTRIIRMKLVEGMIDVGTENFIVVGIGGNGGLGEI